MKYHTTKINPDDYERLCWLAAEHMAEARNSTAKQSLAQVVYRLTPPDMCPQYELDPLLPGGKGHSIRVPDALIYRVDWGLSITATLRIGIAWAFDQFRERVARGEVNESELAVSHALVMAYVGRKYAERAPTAA
jgi:hypothetical protein